MTQNEKLLYFLIQNSQMVVISIIELLRIVKDETFKNQLQIQLEEYKKMYVTACIEANRLGLQKKGLTSFQKARTYIMIDMQTAKDKSNSHIAEMLIIGSTMGVVKSIRDTHRYKDADNSIIEMMKHLCTIEENNIKSLKKFL